MPAPRATFGTVDYALERAVEVARRPGHRDGDPDELLIALDALDAAAFVEFDARARGWSSGLGAGEIARLAPRFGRGGDRRVWSLLALVSSDGRERERAIAACDAAGRAAAALLVVRCADWVPQVRAAALARLGDVPKPLLVELLGLVDHIERERERGGELAAAIEALLGADELRAATSHADGRVRRAGWRGLEARDLLTDEDLWRASVDADVVVRAIAAGRLLAGEGATRRAAAELFLADRVGWLAGRGLDVLVELDGAPAIVAALTAAGTTLRRRARDWSKVRDVDARSLYLDLLRRDATDPVAIAGLAETAEREDAALLQQAAGDPRSRVRAAALRGLARVDPASARGLAVAELVHGRSARTSRAAAAVLRAHAPSTNELRALRSIATDGARPRGQRMRALALMRKARWAHLETVLACAASASREQRPQLIAELDAWLRLSGNVARGPSAEQRRSIEHHLPSLDGQRRASIEFILRATDVSSPARP